MLVEGASAFCITCLATWYWWYASSRKRATLRLIDLASYALTALAIVSALLSFRTYETRMKGANEKNVIWGETLEQTEIILGDLVEACKIESAPPTERSKLAEECLSIAEALKTVSIGDAFTLWRLPIISSDRYTRPEIKSVAQRYAAQIKRLNEKVEAYRNIHQDHLPNLTDALFLLVAIPSLSIAFGLGLVRRIIDALDEWKHRDRI